MCTVIFEMKHLSPLQNSFGSTKTQEFSRQKRREKEERLHLNNTTTAKKILFLPPTHFSSLTQERATSKNCAARRSDRKNEILSGLHVCR